MIYSKFRGFYLLACATFMVALSANAQESTKFNLDQVSKGLLATPMDKKALATIQAHVPLPPRQVESAMLRMASLLKIHFEPAEQQIALHSMLASSYHLKGIASELFKKLPVENVMVQDMAALYEEQRIGMRQARWQEFSVSFALTPQYNIRTVLQLPGVKTLNRVLFKPCPIPKTSTRNTPTNLFCAAQINKNATAVIQRYITNADIILLGEFDGVPVAAVDDTEMQDASITSKLSENPIIIFPLRLLKALQNSPDTLAFLAERQKAQSIRPKSSKWQDTTFDDERHAVVELNRKGMSPEKIAQAYAGYKKVFPQIYPLLVLQDVHVIQDMARHDNNMAAAIENLATTK